MFIPGVPSSGTPGLLGAGSGAGTLTVTGSAACVWIEPQIHTAQEQLEPPVSPNPRAGERSCGRRRSTGVTVLGTGRWVPQPHHIVLLRGPGSFFGPVSSWQWWPCLLGVLKPNRGKSEQELGHKHATSRGGFSSPQGAAAAAQRVLPLSHPQKGSVSPPGP